MRLLGGQAIGTHVKHCVSAALISTSVSDRSVVRVTDYVITLITLFTFSIFAPFVFILRQINEPIRLHQCLLIIISAVVVFIISVEERLFVVFGSGISIS